MSPVLDKESVDLKVLAYKIKENLIQKYFASLQYRTEEGKSINNGKLLFSKEV